MQRVYLVSEDGDYPKRHLLRLEGSAGQVIGFDDQGSLAIIEQQGGPGGGATIPETTNVLIGDGAGNGADSGIDPQDVLTDGWQPTNGYFPLNVIDFSGSIDLSTVLNTGTYSLQPGKVYYGAVTGNKTFTISPAQAEMDPDTVIFAHVTGTGTWTIPTSIRVGDTGSTTTVDVGVTGYYIIRFTKAGDGNLYFVDSIPEPLIESDLTLSDNTTANASTSAHGFLKKLDNTATHYMDGTGNWSTPAPGAVLFGRGYANATVAGSTTSYLGFGGSFSATENLVQCPVTHAGTLKNLYVVTSTNQTGPGDTTATVRKNSVDTSIVATITAGAGAGVFSDASHTVSVVAGDLISVAFTNAASGNSGQVISMALDYQ